jgi:hypothetical protein
LAYRSEIPYFQLPSLYRDKGNECSIEAFLEQPMLVKIVEDAHEIALHYSSTQLKESNNEAIQA